MGKHNRSRSRSPRRSRQRHRSKQKKRSRQRQRDRYGQRHRSKSKQHRQERKNIFSDPVTFDNHMINQASQLSSKFQQNMYGAKEQIKGLNLMKRLNLANKNLNPSLTIVQGNSHFPLGLNTAVFTMNEASKIKRKIMLPKDTNFNYSGLLIGPKGNSQKQLQQKTGCKIVVRGKGSQNQGATNTDNNYDDDQQLHVLVLGDNQAQVGKACAEIERIIFADEQTLNKMKQEQMNQYQQGMTGQGQGDYNLSLTTPYGPPSDSAYILEVPNQCVGLVIGKQGQTIKNIAKKSGAIKVQVATSSAPGSKTRNIFVEGDQDSLQRVRKQLNIIVQTQRKMTSGAVTGSHRTQVQVPTRLIGLVIGKNGETIKGINARTGAFVCLNKDQSKKNRKVLTITGPEDLCMIAEYQIQKIVQKGLINLQNTSGLTEDEAKMIKPITPIAIQLAQKNMAIPTNIQTIKQDPATQYVLNNTLEKQVPTNTLFEAFLGSTKGVVEQVIIQQAPKKRRFLKN